MGTINRIDQKKVFLVASSKPERISWITEKIAGHITDPTVFHATDGATALAKFQNMPPHVLILDLESDLAKLTGMQVLDQALVLKGGESTAYILQGPPPEKEHHLDEIVTGRIQYWTNSTDESEFTACVMKALNYSSHQVESDFHLRFLAQGDVLLREGDTGDFVYFVIKGRLQASRHLNGQEVVLGKIEIGEFVGEMAYINGEVRNAQVQALSDCELIEVPVGRFDKILFRRPSWSKALMMTLSKRLKRSNEIKIQK